MKKTVKIHLLVATSALALESSFAAEGIINGYIGAFSNQLNQKEEHEVPGNRYHGNLFFDYHKESMAQEVRELERRFTFATQVNDENLTTFSLQEAYLGGNLTAKDHIRFGRHILPWSKVDEVWGFGKLNNRRNFDYFEPGQEGLVGISYERRSSNGMRLRFFTSGIYVPELNPPLDIDKKDRTITSRHPWADVPASSAEAEPGLFKQVKYDVDYPEIDEVIYRYSVGGNIGFESKHWVWDNFFIRKPENKMSEKVEVLLDTANDYIEAKVKPQFYYHDVFGSTLKYRNVDLEMYVSGIAIRPNTFPDGNEEAVTYTEIKTEKRREDYLGAGISKVNDVYGLGLNYVARLSSFDRNREVLALDPRWNQAVNVFVHWRVIPSLLVSADVKYDMLTTDRLIMLKAAYHLTSSFRLNAGVHMIGTPDDGKSFWSPYTNNDVIYGGLQYVF